MQGVFLYWCPCHATLCTLVGRRHPHVPGTLDVSAQRHAVPPAIVIRALWCGAPSRRLCWLCPHSWTLATPNTHKLTLTKLGLSLRCGYSIRCSEATCPYITMLFRASPSGASHVEEHARCGILSISIPCWFSIKHDRRAKHMTFSAIARITQLSHAFT